MYFSRFDAVRLAFFGHAVARSGSGRFGSASGFGRFRNQTVRFGSVVRPLRFGFSFLLWWSLVPRGLLQSFLLLDALLLCKL